MLDRRNLLIGTGAAMAALGATAAPAAATGEDVTRVLLQEHPSPAPGWDTAQTLVEIPRAEASGRHSHPGVEIGYLVRGEVRMEFDDHRPPLHLRTGDPFFIPIGVIHNAVNTGRETTMMLSTYVVEKGKPLVTTY
ncbi:cupin domain-containing protein [Streptomyces sp. NPDC047046]|uniref:cupin domain-containing protein n=1 Tax=Streptomyces sp. NPDC047046 TaxID=3155378 RepID=UPI0033C3B7BC